MVWYILFIRSINGIVHFIHTKYQWYNTFYSHEVSMVWYILFTRSINGNGMVHFIHTNNTLHVYVDRNNAYNILFIKTLTEHCNN